MRKLATLTAIAAFALGVGFAGVAEAHFLCYEAEGDDVNATVSLQDQFGDDAGVVEVEEPELFCNPVNKNNEGIGDPTAHLTGYEIERLVIVDNQFGEEQPLTVEEAELLLVPTQKLEVDGEPTGLQGPEALDHFKCFEVEEGDDVNVTVTLEDQFGVELVVEVEEPELFCIPVDKNGEGIFDPSAHLTCYEIDGDSEESEREILVENQFGEQVLEAEEPVLLCVPPQCPGACVSGMRTFADEWIEANVDFLGLMCAFDTTHQAGAVVLLGGPVDATITERWALQVTVEGCIAQGDGPVTFVDRDLSNEEQVACAPVARDIALDLAPASTTCDILSPP